MEEEIHKTMVKRIRDVFLEDWDPIHISFNVNLADEYDMYIEPLIGMAESEKGLTVERIADFLEKCEKEEMGLTSDAGMRDRAAERLFRILRDYREAH